MADLTPWRPHLPAQMFCWSCGIDVLTNPETQVIGEHIAIDPAHRVPWYAYEHGFGAVAALTVRLELRCDCGSVLALTVRRAARP